MADITLHSGSFCDRNNNEISITFFKRTSTPVMTVDPTALSFTSNGGTKQLRVSNYTGTLSISVTGGTGWLSRTQSTSSGVRTYTFTATANTATTMRNATITLTDSNSTVTVGVTQAGAVSNVTVNPNYLVFNKNGETKTTTVTWTGGSTPTWSNEPEWASITSSVSGGTMTLTINVGPNTTQYQRTGMVYVTNGISRADLSLEQEAVHTVSVQPSSFTFPASGGTQVLTISDIQGSFSMNYDGDGLSVILLDYPSSTSRRYNVTYTPNTVTATRTGVINVSDTAGGWVAVTTTQAANTDTFAVSPTSFQYGGTGSTNTFTFTGVPAAGLSYDIPSGVDWVTVSNLTNASVDITTSANNNPTSRTTTVKFYDMDDIDNYVTVTVNQDAGQSSLSVVPSSITYLPAGGTYGITATWTAGTEPTATIRYVQGTGGWMTPTGSGTVTGNTKEWAWTASANYTGSSRTALITVTNGLQSEYVTVSQSSTTPPVVNWEVTPSSITGVSASGNTYSATITGAPSGGMSYDVIYGSGSGWVTVSNFSSSGCTVAVGANSGSSQRTATVKFIDQDDIDHYITLTITQDGVIGDLSVSPENYIFAAGSNTTNVSVSNVSGNVSTSVSGNWLSVGTPFTSGGNMYYPITAASNSLSFPKYDGAVTFTDDRGVPVVFTAHQRTKSSATMALSPMQYNIGSSGGTVNVNIVGCTNYVNLVSISQSWIEYAGTPITTASNLQIPISVAANTSTSRRSSNIWFSDYYTTAGALISQSGATPASSISVTPSRVDLSYGNDSETLTISGVPSGGYSTSISYNTGASGWLNLVSTAYNIIVTAGTTTYPSSRTATLTVTNASVPSDSVVIPITQAGNPQVLSVTPNAWTYTSSLGTHAFTVIYNASGSITTSVAYEREEGEEELDWLEVELVEHEEGSETWIYSIDVGPNNTGSGREAMVTFTGDGGGADEVTVYQQP